MSTKLLDTQPIPPEMMVSVSAAAHDAMVLELEELVLAGWVPWQGSFIDHASGDWRTEQEWEQQMLNEIGAVVADVICKHVPEFKEKAESFRAGKIPLLAYKGLPTRGRATQLLQTRITEELSPEDARNDAIDEARALLSKRREEPVGDYTELFGLGIGYLLQGRALTPLCEATANDLVRSDQYVAPLGWHADFRDTSTILIGEQGAKGAETTFLTYDALLEHPTLAQYRDVLLSNSFVVEPIQLKGNQKIIHKDDGLEEDKCIPAFIETDGHLHMHPHFQILLFDDTLEGDQRRAGVKEASEPKAQEAFDALRNILEELRLRLHKSHKHLRETDTVNPQQLQNMETHAAMDGAIVPYAMKLEAGSGVVFGQTNLTHARTGYVATPGEQRSFTFQVLDTLRQPERSFTAEEIAALKTTLPDTIRGAREYLGFPVSPPDLNPDELYATSKHRFRSSPQAVERLRAQRERDDSSEKGL